MKKDLIIENQIRQSKALITISLVLFAIFLIISLAQLIYPKELSTESIALLSFLLTQICRLFTLIFGVATAVFYVMMPNETLEEKKDYDDSSIP